MIIVGQGPQPHWVWVSAARVERIRTRLALTGLPLIGMALVFGVVLVAVGLNLPSSDNPINVIGVMTAGIGAFWGVLSGLSLATARSRARGEFVDVNGARLVRRLLGVWWGGAIFCALVAGFAEVMALNAKTRPVPFTVGSAVYLALLVVLVVLGGVAFFTARRVLRVA
ncbi:hypothetical protein [Lentzea aerocolonigenes]|uniref:hypothetical protein n=1 Tax=Lentzea aerocolonigenes TaxID=68170 RepID=UPI0004C39E8A|nr:hypothetical protein [Lentzea aerocolonigenes]MCP2248974.1 hypothetical protein [Lentzea aerocolonigenes]